MFNLNPRHPAKAGTSGDRDRTAEEYRQIPAFILEKEIRDELLALKSTKLGKNEDGPIIAASETCWRSETSSGGLSHGK